MLTFVLRRILYSIPVILIASFLLFAFTRATFDPTARLRASRSVRRVAASQSSHSMSVSAAGTVPWAGKRMARATKPWSRYWRATWRRL